MKTNVIIQGLGFVGSAMATAVASKLDNNNQPIFNVKGIDLPFGIGRERIDLINQGIFPFKTNDTKLSKKMNEAVKRGNLQAVDNKSVYSKADIVLVSINCDLIIENSKEKINLKTFSNSIKEIAENINEGTLVIIESTVPPGTCEKIVYPIFQDIFNQRKININNFYLAHSYERVMPGDQYFDSIINYWRVYAGINEESSRRCNNFLSQVINVDDYPLTCLKNIISSETGKLLENSYRAVNISFIEEWGRFAEDVGIDLYEVIDAIRMRPTHNNIRQPGFGVGGYCLTKDPLFAKIAARDILEINGHEFPFSTEAIKINSKMPLITLNKINNYFNNKTKGKKLLLMGATYRQDVGDTRFSPSEIFAREAISKGYKISVYDPLIKYWEEMELEILAQLPSLEGFDAVIFAVKHKEFTEISFDKWVEGNSALVFDANNVLTPKQVKQITKTNVNYISIGRG